MAEVTSEQSNPLLLTNIACDDDPVFLPDQLYAEIDDYLTAQDVFLKYFRHFNRLKALDKKDIVIDRIGWPIISSSFYHTNFDHPSWNKSFCVDVCLAVALNQSFIPCNFLTSAGGFG